MAEILQLGEKSWTRWENGKERLSRSMNVLLCALYDGRIELKLTESLAAPLVESIRRDYEDRLARKDTDSRPKRRQ